MKSVTSDFIRAIAHDEEAFDSPYDFDPDRFLPAGKQSKTQMDPRKLVFGYGRRVCPGAPMRYASRACP